MAFHADFVSAGLWSWNTNTIAPHQHRSFQATSWCFQALGRPREGAPSPKQNRPLSLGNARISQTSPIHFIIDTAVDGVLRVGAGVGLDIWRACNSLGHIEVIAARYQAV